MSWTPTVLSRAGVVKGWDFPQFFAMGELAARGNRAGIADGPTLGKVATQDISTTLASTTFVPVYGPQVALAFAPFGLMSYIGALRCWLALSVILYSLCCVVLWKSCPALREHVDTVTLLALGSPFMFFLMGYAQLSAVGLAIFTVAFVALEQDRPIMAGAALGSLIYKPQLCLAMGAIFLLSGEWRIVSAALAFAAGQIAVAWTYAGTAVMRMYVHTLVHLNDNIVLVQQKSHLLHSLWSFFGLILPPPWSVAASLVTAVPLFIAAWLVWKTHAPLALRYSMLLLTNVLISPHFYIYDLMILTPIFFVLTDWAIQRTNGRERTVVLICLGMLYFAPLVGGIAALKIHFQPTVPIMLGLAFCLVRIVMLDKARLSVGSARQYSL
jgi:alpha-1,2-mannosyltransferase